MPLCKTFFLAVRSISATVVATALPKKQLSSITLNYQQGAKSPGNKTTKSKLKVVRDHTASFPTIPSHYTRKDTAKQYLKLILNIAKMYELYVKDCTKINLELVKSNIYRKIFNIEYNIAFHKPQKDTCLQCNKYKTGVIEKDYNQHQHIMRKERARKEKQEDKDQAKRSCNVHTCTLGLQPVVFALSHPLVLYTINANSMFTTSALILWGQNRAVAIHGMKQKERENQLKLAQHYTFTCQPF